MYNFNQTTTREQHTQSTSTSQQKQKAKATPTCIPATAQNNTPNTGHCRWWLAYHPKDAYWSRDDRNNVVIMACLHIHIYAQKLKKQSAMRNANAQCAMRNVKSAICNVDADTFKINTHYTSAFPYRHAANCRWPSRYMPIVFLVSVANLWDYMKHSCRVQFIFTGQRCME